MLQVGMVRTVRPYQRAPDVLEVVLARTTCGAIYRIMDETLMAFLLERTGLFIGNSAVSLWNGPFLYKIRLFLYETKS